MEGEKEGEMFRIRVLVLELRWRFDQVLEILIYES